MKNKIIFDEIDFIENYKDIKVRGETGKCVIFSFPKTKKSLYDEFYNKKNE